MHILAKLKLYMEYGDWEECDYIALSNRSIFYGKGITIDEFLYYIGNTETKVVGEKDKDWDKYSNQLPKETRTLKSGCIYTWTGVFRPIHNTEQTIGQSEESKDQGEEEK